MRNIMSFKPMVQTDSTGKWYGNALRFATQDEAEQSALNLVGRWMAVREHTTVESDDPVNYTWDKSQGLVAII